MTLNSTAKFLIGFAGLIVLVITGIAWAGRVTHLDAPLLKITKTVVGKNTLITGIAYPNSKVALYVNGNFVSDAQADAQGSFQGNIEFPSEGTSTVKAKQIYGSVTSEFSPDSLFTVDLTPPNVKSFVLTTDIPTFSTNSNLTLKGHTAPGDQVYINGEPRAVEKDGTFSIEYPLQEGANQINFDLADEANNKVHLETHTVTVDSLPPKISTTGCTSPLDMYSSSYTPVEERDLKSTEEYICVSTGQWESWEDPAPIPIVGKVKGEFSQILVNGTTIYPDEHNEIYQRVYLPVPKGLNKYRVVAIDKHGNKSTANLTMTVERVQSSYQDDVIDRLDDIDSRLDDINN